MGRRVRAGLFAAAAAGILTLLSRAPEPSRTAVLGEQAEVTAADRSRPAVPSREGRAAARVPGTPGRR